MKYIISLVFLLSLLPFMSVDALSEDVRPSLEERKQQNYETRSQLPPLPVNNPAIQESAVRNAEQNQIIKDTRTPRDEQTPRDRQAVLCDPKFGGSPNDPGCQKPTPAPTPYDPGDGGKGGDDRDNDNDNPSPEEGVGEESPSSANVVVGLSKTSGTPFPITSIIGLICLAKGLILVKKSRVN